MDECNETQVVHLMVVKGEVESRDLVVDQTLVEGHTLSRTSFSQVEVFDSRR